MTASRPLVGVTTSLEHAVEGPWEDRYALLPEAYLLAVEEGGGAPVLLPPQPVDDDLVGRVLGAVDALVLAGGADVDPASYGAEPDPRTSAPQPARDAWEAALVRAAIARRVPVLAVCRGVQLLNTALGGTLLQHVPDVTATDHGETPGGYARVDVQVEPGSRVGRLLGPAGARLRVHCAHHQALDRLGDGLVVAARATDGIVEAVELPGEGFVVGVQWHPEQDAADRRLFRALVDAAG
jgi:putative glutamine amidotransferase